MSDFEKLNKKSYSFSSCDNCEAECCDGSKNILYSQIVLEDFEKIVKYFPILFTIGNRGYLRPVVLLTNGKDFCKYINNFKCSIYENRPSICRIYPFSPCLDDEVYIDNSCPAVTFEDKERVDNIKIIEKFKNPILTDYTNKYIETFSEFKQYNTEENIELAVVINSEKFYKFNKDFNNPYVKLHLQSLLHLNDDYFKN